MTGRRSLYLLWVLAFFAIGYFLSFLYRSVNAVLAPDLVKEFALSPASLGMLTAAYFLTFSAAQLPMGLALDRFGPRRVDGCLLLVAATGALVFAFAESVEQMAVGRALIGLGVCSCLMAAITNNAQWFEPKNWAKAHAFILLFGGLGSVAAASPIEFLLQSWSWREIFVGMALVTMAVALGLLTIVPDPPDHGQFERESLKTLLIGLSQIVRSRIFLRVMPYSALAQASHLSVAGLWIGPWLGTVNQLPRDDIAEIVSYQAIGMLLGYFGSGLLANFLARYHVPLLRTAGLGMVLFTLTCLWLVADPQANPILQWLLFGITGGAGVVCYAGLGQFFPKQQAGRVNTAQNFCLFLLALVFQFAFGWMLPLVEGWQDLTGLGSYQLTLLILVAFQILGILCFPWSNLSPVASRNVI